MPVLSRDLVTERHWNGSDRSAFDSFWHVASTVPPKEVEPLIVTPKGYIFHVFRHDLFFVATCSTESPPLLIIELLNRFGMMHACMCMQNFLGGKNITHGFRCSIVLVLEEYLGASFNEESLRENFVSVLQVTDEMFDTGYPFTTEPTVLKGIVRPPTIINRVRSAVTGSGSVNTAIPEGTASVVWWRRPGIKYSNNEMFFDIIEELNALVDRFCVSPSFLLFTVWTVCVFSERPFYHHSNGGVLSSEVTGRIRANCKLTGMPDVLVTFENANVLDDCSFHPCVRYARYEQDKSLFFIPPNEPFDLISYRCV